MSKRHAFGQHFLIDTSICERIVDTFVEVADQSHLWVEIGPGRGALTEIVFRHLETRDFSKRPTFMVIEKDREIASFWRETFETPTGAKPRVVEGDFLDVGSEAIKAAAVQKVSVLSNLPYSSSTAILLELTELAGSHPQLELSDMVLMFQLEVAQRLRAGPSQEGRGSLSIWLQNEWDIEPVCKVSPAKFRPRPKVDSEVVKLRRRANPQIELTDRNLFQKLLRHAFMHRRKMLRSVFGRDPLWGKALEMSGVDGTRRPESLDWNDWRSLYQSAVSLRGTQT